MATLRVGDPSSSTKVMYAHATDTQATVLVLDDEASVRKVMGRVLGKRGYRVIEVDTAARAVDALRTTPVHAVVLDVRLPEGSGLDVLSPLRRQLELKKIPVLVWTGANMSSKEKFFINCHEAHLFLKPEGLNSIADFLDVLMGRDRMH